MNFRVHGRHTEFGQERRAIPADRLKGMSYNRLARFVAALMFGFAIEAIAVPAASAQASPTATLRVDLSAFAGVTGTYTGLEDGKNAAITAGLNLGLRKRFGVRPSVEVRGTLPFDKGNLNSERDVLGGLRTEFTFRHLYPYADFLVGRGDISYTGTFSPASEGLVYGRSSSTVYSPGGGIRYGLGRNLSVFGDVQLQHWATPVAASGHIYSKPFTAGLVYRFAYGLPRKP